MPGNKKRKTLHLKLALIGIFTTFIPLLATLFLEFNLIFALAAAFITSLLTILLLFWAIKPISKILQGFEGFSDGNLNQRLDIRSEDEFEDLANSFNLMAAKVATLMQKNETDQISVSAQRNKLESILSSVVDGIIALDLSKSVVLVNKTAEYLTGYSESEIKGKPINEFIRVYSDGEEILVKNFCQPQFNQTANLIGKGGKEVKVNITSAPISENIQTNLGCILILHDLTKEEELEQMKLDFVSMASHELKTPLTNIIGYLSVFINENKGKIEKEEIELLEKSLVSSKELYSLVSNLLSVNKIERDQLSVSGESIEYTAILQKAVEDLQNQAKLKNITLILNLPEEKLPKVLADQIRIAEVLDNLVANAINYTDPGGEINIYVTFSPTEVTTSIKDTGVGIPKEALPHLFTKFFRVSNTAQKVDKGTGLGLYISKSIIEKMKGKIWVESEEGKGSKFSFTLPIASINKSSFDESKFDAQAIQAGNLSY